MTNWTHSTPLADTGSLARAMVLTRVEGATPTDPSQDTTAQMSIADIIALASNPAQESSVAAAASALASQDFSTVSGNYANSAALSQQQAAVAAAIQNVLPSAPTSLPFEVTAISGGVGTGTGGLPGEYALGVANGAGSKAYVTIGTDGKVASYRNANPGLSVATFTPVYSLSGVPGLTGATAPTATVGTILVNRVFNAPSADGTQLLAWGNNLGALATAPFGLTQLSLPTSAGPISNLSVTSYEDAIAQLLGPNNEFLWDVDTLGRLRAQFALLAGTGMTITYDAVSKQTTLNSSTDFGGSSIVTNFNAESAVFQLLGPNNELIYAVYADGTDSASSGAAAAAVAPVNAEVAASRGLQSTLAARLDTDLDSYGFVDRHVRGEGFIRRWRLNRRRLLPAPQGMGVTGLNHHIVLAPTDSYTYMRRWSKTFARFMKGMYGDGGPGWVGFGFIPGNPGSYNNSVDDGETSAAFTGSWVGLYTGNINSPDLCSATSSTAGDRIQLNYYGVGGITLAQLHFVGATGVVRYSFDSGTTWAGTLTLSGTGPQALPFSGFSTSGTFTTIFEVVSGTCQLTGAFLRKGTTGIIVSSLANTGSALASWARAASGTATADRAAIAAAMGTLPVPVDEFIAMIGANEQTQGWPLASYPANMKLFIDEVMRIVAPSADIIWAMQPENGRGLLPLMADMATQARIMAKAEKVTWFNMQHPFGEVFSFYASEFDSDTLHPNVTLGGPHMADLLISLHQNLT